MLLVLRYYPNKITVLYPTDEVACSSKSLCINKTTQHHISDDSSLYTHFCEHLNQNKLQPQQVGPVKYETGMPTSQLQYSVRFRRPRNRKDCHIIPTISYSRYRNRQTAKKNYEPERYQYNFYCFSYDRK